MRYNNSNSKFSIAERDSNGDDQDDMDVILDDLNLFDLDGSKNTLEISNVDENQADFLDNINNINANEFSINKLGVNSSDISKNNFNMFNMASNVKSSINVVNTSKNDGMISSINNNDNNINNNNNYDDIGINDYNNSNANIEIINNNSNNSNNINNNPQIDGIQNPEVFNDIKHILTSTLRTKLIISLFSSKKDLKSLRNILNKPSTSILHGIKELKKLKLIKKEDKFYDLSSNGKIVAANILKLIENTYSINNNFEFWKSHSIDDIPEEFLKKIHYIHNAVSVSSIGGIYNKNSNEYLKLISKSKNIRILTPIFFDIHLDMIINNLNIHGSLELITTEEILDFIKINGYGYKLLSLYEDLDIKIWKFPNDFKIFLTACDNFLSLGLFDDSHYDDSSMLLDENKNGIKWGLALFEYYKKNSEFIDIEEYFDVFEGHE